MGGFFRFRHWALGTTSSASWGTFQKSCVLTHDCFGCYLESLERHSLINMSDYWALILACWNSIRDSYTQGHSGLILHHEVIWNGKCPCVKKTAFLTHNKTTSHPGRNVSKGRCENVDPERIWNVTRILDYIITFRPMQHLPHGAFIPISPVWIRAKFRFFICFLFDLVRLLMAHI